MLGIGLRSTRGNIGKTYPVVRTARPTALRHFPQGQRETSYFQLTRSPRGQPVSDQRVFR